jgi:hypothetical protein
LNQNNFFAWAKRANFFWVPHSISIRDFIQTSRP